MANRSDFFNAKLPRQWKRIFAMGQTYDWNGDEHNRGSLKRLMIQAHASHVGFKMKRHNTENRDAGDSE
jgi:hypothetical protein